MRSLNQSLFNEASFATNFIVTKTNESTGDKVPQQGIYLGAWDPSNAPDENGNSGLVHGNSLLKLFYAKLLGVPILRNFVKYLSSTTDLESLILLTVNTDMGSVFPFTLILP